MSKLLEDRDYVCFVCFCNSEAKVQVKGSQPAAISDFAPKLNLSQPKGKKGEKERGKKETAQQRRHCCRHFNTELPPLLLLLLLLQRQQRMKSSSSRSWRE